MDDRELLVAFSFVCHNDNVSRVKNLLVDLGMTSIYATDSEIHGVCEITELKEVMHVLAQNKVAGLSSDTQIHTRPYIPAKSSKVN